METRVKLLKKFYIEWLDTQYNLAENTKLTYGSIVNRMNMNSHSDLLKQLGEIREEQADKTFNLKISALKHFNGFLKVFDPSDPLISIIESLEQLKNVVWNPHKPYTHDEITRILNTAKGWRKVALYIAANAGLRKSEIFKLNINDVDFSNNWIQVKYTKGNKMRRVGIADIEPLKKWADKHKVTAGIKSDSLGIPFLFTNRGSRPVFSSGAIFNTLDDKLGFKITMHRLRATFATQLYRRTKDAILVKEQLGHRSLETTMAYIQLFPHERVETIKKLGRLF